MSVRETYEPVTIDDLPYIFIRAQMPNGSWGSINLADASSPQFDVWAQSRLDGIVGDQEWTPQQRVYFCDFLRRLGDIVMAE